jgi:hypothetical protein
MNFDLFRCPAIWVPPGLTRLDIEPEAEVHAALRTPTAQAMVARGAALWVCEDGTTALSIERPAGAFAKACGVADLYPEEAH